MTALLVQGISIGLSAGLVPGPLLAIFLNHASRFGWRRTLPVVAAPLISDGPIILLTLAILSQVPDRFLQALRLGGGLFLIYLAAGMFRNRGAADTPDENPRALRNPLWTAVAINLLNPNPYIFWGAVLGPILVTGWRSNPLASILFVAVFYLAMIAVFAAWIIIFGRAAELSPRVRCIVTLVSSLGMAGFGVYQVLVGVGWLAAG